MLSGSRGVETLACYIWDSHRRHCKKGAFVHQGSYYDQTVLGVQDVGGLGFRVSVIKTCNTVL